MMRVSVREWVMLRVMRMLEISPEGMEVSDEFDQLRYKMMYDYLLEIETEEKGS